MHHVVTRRALPWLLTIAVLAATLLPGHPAAAAEGGRIFGTVVGPDGPLPGALINAFAPVTNSAGVTQLAASGSATSGANGSYSIAAKHDRIVLEVRPNQPELQWSYYPSGQQLSFAEEISVPAGQDHHVNVEVRRPNVISGRVTDPEGQPVAGASVNGTLTDAGGRYRLAGIDDARRYEVKVVPPAARRNLRSHTSEPFRLGPGADRTLDVGLLANSTLSGTVTDWDGKPLAEAYLNHPDGHTRTDAQGRYELPAGATAGPLWVTRSGYADHKADVPALAVGETKVVDVRLHRQNTVGVMVTDDAGRIMPAEVDFIGEPGTPTAGITARGYLAPGQYRIRVSAKPAPAIAFPTTWYPAAPGTGEPITVVDGGVRPQVSVTVDPDYSRISGTVRLDGEPVPGVKVTSYGGKGGGTVETDANGRYTMSTLGGDFHFSVATYPWRAGFYPQFEGGGTRPEGAPVISVERGQSVTHDIDLLRGGSLAGRIVDANGDPIKDASVGVVAEGPTIDAERRNGWTTADGKYEIGALPPGRWRVYASKPGLADSANSVVTIKRGATTTWSPVLGQVAQAGSISGVVRDDAQRGVATQVEVVPADDVDGNAVVSTTSNSAGAFAFASVPAGQYTLRLGGSDPSFLGGSRDPGQAESFTVAAGTQTQLDVLRSTRALRLEVVDAATGKPVSPFQVTVSAKSGSSGPKDVTGGSVELHNLDEGPITLTVATGLHVTRTHTVTDLPLGAVTPLRLELTSLAVLQGTYVDPAGRPVDARDSYLEEVQSGVKVPLDAYDGSFKLQWGLEPGQYRVRLDAYGFQKGWLGGPDPDSATVVTVAHGQVSDLGNIVLTPLPVPAAPAAPAVSAQQTAVLATWGDLQPDVNGVRVTAQPGGASCVTGSVYPLAGQQCRVAGLKAGGTYTFTMSARTEGGWSPESEATGPVTTKVAQFRPTAPMWATAVPGDRSATVSWGAPGYSGDDPALRYEVRANGGLVCQTAANSCVVGGLANGVGYQFSVVAMNSVGTSGAALSSIVTPVAPTPQPPTPQPPTPQPPTPQPPAPPLSATAITGFSRTATTALAGRSVADNVTVTGGAGRVLELQSLSAPGWLAVRGYPLGTEASQSVRVELPVLTRPTQWRLVVPGTSTAAAAQTQSRTISPFAQTASGWRSGTVKARKSLTQRFVAPGPNRKATVEVLRSGKWRTYKSVTLSKSGRATVTLASAKAPRHYRLVIKGAKGYLGSTSAPVQVLR